MIRFAFEHQFLAGMIVGGMCFGGPLGIIGWTFGYESAMRKWKDWMQPKVASPSVIPDLPPNRERRLSTVAHREWLS